MMIRLLAVVACLCLSHAAQAQNAWSAPASACIPDHNATGRYETDTASVTHAAAEVDTIVLNCQMDRFDSGTTDWNLRITYRDSTGMNAQSSVRAWVYRMALGTATPIELVEVTSNASAVTGTNTVGSNTFTHAFNFEANTYWVRVILKRKSTNQTAIFYAVYLDGTVI